MVEASERIGLPCFDHRVGDGCTGAVDHRDGQRDSSGGIGGSGVGAVRPGEADVPVRPDGLRGRDTEGGGVKSPGTTG